MNICLHRNKTNDEYSCTVKSTVTYIFSSQKSIIEFSKKSIKFSFWPDQDNSTLQCSVASNVRKFVNDLEIPREIHVIKMFLLGILQTNVIVHANKKKKNCRMILERNRVTLTSAECKDELKKKILWF